MPFVATPLPNKRRDRHLSITYDHSLLSAMPERR
jgi:hypothetical protein